MMLYATYNDLGYETWRTGCEDLGPVYSAGNNRWDSTSVVDPWGERALSLEEIEFHAYSQLSEMSEDTGLDMGEVFFIENDFLDE